MYVGGASGGIWKTTDFLRPADGPTYIPLTDFGPTNAINVGGIAVFGRNNDPGHQSSSSAPAKETRARKVWAS